MSKQLQVSKEKQKEMMASLMTEPFRKAYEATLPTTLRKYMSLDTAVNIIGRAVQVNPKLLVCDPRSIQQALIDTAALGLELAGPLHQAYLIPFWDSRSGTTKAQMQIGYPGYLELMQRSERFDGAPIVQWVFERDHFDPDILKRDGLSHRPYLEGDRGKPKLVYFMAWFRTGGYHFDFKTYQQIIDHRERYVRKDKNGNWPEPWDDQKNFPAFLEMGRKTMIRLAQKHLPKSAQLASALEYEERADMGISPTIVDWAPTSDSLPVADAEQEKPAPQKVSRTAEVKAALKAAPAPAPAEEPTQPSSLPAKNGKKVVVQDNTAESDRSFIKILDAIDMVRMPTDVFHDLCHKVGVDQNDRRTHTQKKLEELEYNISAWVDEQASANE